MLWRFQAQHGRDALDVLAARKDIRLVLSDVVMPILGGTEFARELATAHPDLPVIGYARDVVFRASADARGGNSLNQAHSFLQKPIDPATLMNQVRSALRAARADGSALSCLARPGSRS